jgi:hypothetical protein
VQRVGVTLLLLLLLQLVSAFAVDGGASEDAVQVRDVIRVCRKGDM